MNTRPVTRLSGSKTAFTRADALALVLVVTLLSLLTVPSLARVTGRSAIAGCAANLQHYLLALEIYGNDNRDVLPDNSNGYWAWDASISYQKVLTNNGISFTSLYCPGTSDRFTEQDDWNLFNFSPSNFGVLGYAAALWDVPSFGTDGSYKFATNANYSFSAQRIAYSGSYLPVVPAIRPLVADATLASDPGSLPPPGPALQAAELDYNWTQVAGGYPKNHHSPHLNGNIPLGGNVGMLDGHVQWQPFTNMLPRAGGGTPVFFW